MLRSDDPPWSPPDVLVAAQAAAEARRRRFEPQAQQAPPCGSPPPTPRDCETPSYLGCRVAMTGGLSCPATARPAACAWGPPRSGAPADARDMSAIDRDARAQAYRFAGINLPISCGRDKAAGAHPDMPEDTRRRR
jgi:hypothetical protein